MYMVRHEHIGMDDTVIGRCGVLQTLQVHLIIIWMEDWLAIVLALLAAVLDDGPWCRCGGRGCLAHAFGGFLAPFVESSFGKPLGFADLLNFTRHGEAGTFRIVADAGRRVGRVLADLCTMLSPEAVIVDGMLGAATAPFITGLREMIDRHMPAATVAAVQTVGSELGDRAELLGAVALARQEYLDLRARQ